MRHALALSTLVLIASASMPLSALPTICIPPDTKQERVELAATLTALGYTVVDSKDPAGSNCDVYTTAFLNSNFAHDDSVQQWVHTGGLYIEMLGPPEMIGLAGGSIHNSSPAELVVMDRSHPMTHCLPARWATRGGGQYPVEPNFGYVYFSVTLDPDLPILGQFRSTNVPGARVFTTETTFSKAEAS